MTDRGTIRFSEIILCIVPVVALVAVLGLLSIERVSASDWGRYLRYREFWGGNPAEVYSHWLDMVLMSGNAAALAWLLSTEAFFRRNLCRHKWVLPLTHACAVLSVVLSGAIALVLDYSHGEGTVLLAYPVIFLPILGSSYYLLRRVVRLVNWRLAVVVALSASYAALHAAAQLHYEPSETGAPNGQVIGIWLGSVGLAFIWALVEGIRTGALRRFFIQVGRVVSKPIVWASGTAIVLAVGVPVTIHAHLLHGTRERLVIPWLDELETKLSEPFVAEIRREHTSAKPIQNVETPMPAAAHALFDDPRIKEGNSLRIFIPVSQTDYLFLWGNERFEYCDIRNLPPGGNEQIDQAFIDALIAHGGTYQTGLYPILWSPHLAGRVIKNAVGRVQAICVIDSP